MSASFMPRWVECATELVSDDAQIATADRLDGSTRASLTSLADRSQPDDYKRNLSLDRSLSAAPTFSARGRGGAPKQDPPALVAFHRSRDAHNYIKRAGRRAERLHSAEACG